LLGIFCRDADRVEKAEARTGVGVGVVAWRADYSKAIV